jgi:hypothetical protein
MRAGRTTSAALLAGATLALTTALAPAALAAPDLAPSGSGVSPAIVVPGGGAAPTAARTAAFAAPGCPDRAAASARAFFDGAILGKGGTPGRAGSVAAPGARYDTVFTCGSEARSTPLTIGDGVTAPTGAVETGLGGGVPEPNAAEILASVALAGAVGVIAVRRRRATRG